MRILFAGATGILGRATLAHLGAHDVVGLTRCPRRAQRLRELGVEAAVCDVLDYESLVDIARRARPQTVVNFVTDLASGSTVANARARREGGGNVLNAAEQAGAARLVVESVAFTLQGDAAAAVEQLEQATRTFPGEALVLRFGRLWGPGTFHRVPPAPPAVHVEEAGAEAARMLVEARPGIYLVT